MMQKVIRKNLYIMEKSGFLASCALVTQDDLKFPENGHTLRKSSNTATLFTPEIQHLHYKCWNEN